MPRAAAAAEAPAARAGDRRADMTLASADDEDEVDEETAGKRREDLFNILFYLKNESDEGAKSLEDIADAIGVEMLLPIEGQEPDERAQLYLALKRNPRAVEVDVGKFKYHHHLNGVRDVKEWIERNPSGVSLDDLLEYFGDDWQATGNEMIFDGSVIALKETNKNKVFLYPRTDEFLVPLSGTVSAKPGDPYVTTSCDLTKEIRRGDAVRIAGKVYRVSVRPNGKGPEMDMFQLSRTKAPYSSSSTEESALFPPKDGFKYNFTSKLLPIDPPYREEAALLDGQAFKFGCTNDVRAVWRKLSLEPATQFTPGQFRSLDALLEGKIMSRETLDGYNRNRDERSERVNARQVNAAAAGTRKRRRGVQSIGAGASGEV